METDISVHKGKISFMRNNFMMSLRDMLKKALETGSSLYKDPRWGNWRGFVFRDF